MMYLTAFALFLSAAQLNPDGSSVREGVHFTRSSDVVYGRKHGVALTLDVLTPSRARGIGIIWVVSRNWFSDPSLLQPEAAAKLLERGYTVFAVFHGSQPKYAIPEMIEDVARSVRFIRHGARRFGIDPETLGIFGYSSGAHLALLQATAGEGENPSAMDSVDRQSARVQAVACFFPQTDFLHFGGPDSIFRIPSPPRGFRAAFQLTKFDPVTERLNLVDDPRKVEAIAEMISPAYSVTSEDPPALLIHGDADAVVPYQQSTLMMERFRAAGVISKLITREGRANGWDTMYEDVSHCADWFDKHLVPKSGGETQKGRQDRSTPCGR